MEYRDARSLGYAIRLCITLTTTHNYLVTASSTDYIVSYICTEYKVVRWQRLRLTRRLQLEALPLYSVIIMGDRNSSLLSPDCKQHGNVPGDSKDSDDNRSDGDINWTPEDGICPTTAQSNRCCQSKFDEWKGATSMHLEDYDLTSIRQLSWISSMLSLPSFTVLHSLSSRTHQHYR